LTAVAQVDGSGENSKMVETEEGKPMVRYLKWWNDLLITKQEEFNRLETVVRGVVPERVG